MINRLKALWKREGFQLMVTLLIIISVVFGGVYGSQIVFNTKITPVLTVVSGSMSIPYYQASTGWMRPFDRTLQIGDLIIIQGVNPQDLNANYPNSNIIVFHNPDQPNELIVHRIISKTIINGTIYFQTKGDGNGNPWPQTPQTGLDQWDFNNPPGVPQNLVVGKVIMRIPWIGFIPMIFQQNGATKIMIWLAIIIVTIVFAVYSVLPFLKKRKTREHYRPIL